jgi:hypothetical protein
MALPSAAMSTISKFSMAGFLFLPTVSYFMDTKIAFYGRCRK